MTAKAILWKSVNLMTWRTLKGINIEKSGGGTRHIALLSTIPLEAVIGPFLPARPAKRLRDAVALGTVTLSPGHERSIEIVEEFRGPKKHEARIPNQFGAQALPRWRHAADSINEPVKRQNPRTLPIIYLMLDNQDVLIHGWATADVMIREYRIRPTVNKSSGVVLPPPGQTLPLPSGRQFDSANDEEEAVDPYQPDRETRTEYAQRNVRQRQGQVSFRRRLFEAYGRTCCLSGCDVEVVLEAAHIDPYVNPASNHVANGLLLRADLHTLFDLGMIKLDANNWPPVIQVHPSLKSTDYSRLEGQPLRLPGSSSQHPDKHALKRHFEAFAWT